MSLIYGEYPRVSGNHVRFVLNKAPGKMAAAKCVHLLLLWLALCRCEGREDQSYSEALFMKLLADGRVSATFEFSTVWSVHPLLFAHPGNGEDVMTYSKVKVTSFSL